MEQSLLELILTDGNIYNTIFNSVAGVALGSTVVFVFRKHLATSKKELDAANAKLKELEDWKFAHSTDYANFKGRTEAHQSYKRQDSD